MAQVLTVLKWKLAFSSDLFSATSVLVTETVPELLQNKMGQQLQGRACGRGLILQLLLLHLLTRKLCQMWQGTASRCGPQHSLSSLLLHLWMWTFLLPFSSLAVSALVNKSGKSFWKWDFFVLFSLLCLNGAGVSVSYAVESFWIWISFCWFLLSCTYAASKNSASCGREDLMGAELLFCHFLAASVQNTKMVLHAISSGHGLTM